MSLVRSAGRWEDNNAIMPRKPAPPPQHVTQWFKQQGAKGGHKSAQTLTPEQRSERARKAAQALWAQKRAQQQAQEQPEQTTPAPEQEAQNQAQTLATITITDPELLERIAGYQAKVQLDSLDSTADILLRAGLNTLSPK